jgi:hypothetical protein
MRVEGPHEWLEMTVISPKIGEKPGRCAKAISMTVFGKTFAGHPDYIIEICPPYIGDVQLHEGHTLEAYGNTAARRGDEVRPVDIRFLED